MFLNGFDDNYTNDENTQSYSDLDAADIAINKYKDEIKRVHDSLDKKVLMNMCEYIKNAEGIDIYAKGIDITLAEGLQDKLCQNGKDCLLIYSNDEINNDRLTIIISLGVEDIDNINMIKEDNFVIGILSNNNTLEKICDEAIIVDNEDVFQRYTDVTYIIDIIHLLLMKRQKDNA